MKKRYLLIPVFLLAAVILTAAVFAADGEIPQASETLREISSTYIPGGLKEDRTLSCAFPYSDAMLLGDANVFSGDVAKASVILATQAYDQNRVNSVLDSMGYVRCEHSAGINTYDRADHLTVWDNDYVAYTIAYRDVQYRGENYRIYCVPVKGTSANAEWFSNFNLGTGLVHEGFRIAAEDLYQELIKQLSGDGFDTDHCVIWLTGHSRGAAVSNLVAGWLAERADANPEHVFGYNFACPAVSKTADTTMTNIYNFNNPGDPVPLLPMEAWGYHRYGVSIEQFEDFAEDDIAYQFERLSKETLDLRMRSTWLSLFHALVPSQEDFYAEQDLFSVISWALQWKGVGKSQVGMTDLLLFLGYQDTDMVVKQLAKITNGIPGVKATLTTLKDQYAAELLHAQQMIADTEGMTEEAAARYLSKQADMVKSLEKYTDVEIKNLETLEQAYQICCRAQTAVQDLSDIIASGDNLFFDPDGNISTAFRHGHTQLTYIVWMNAAYFGNQGWAYYPDPCSLEIDKVKHIGSSCFYGSTGLKAVTIANGAEVISGHAFEKCTGITDVVIPDTMQTLGYGAFVGCTRLQSLTLPIDLETIKPPLGSARAVFSECKSLRELHYTAGKTGCQPDRTGSGDLYYGFGPEQLASGSLTTITYQEGVKRIGNYALNMDNDGRFEKITQLSLPSTLESIGSYAFCGLKSLESLELPNSVTKLGFGCFYKCGALKTLSLSNSLTSIPGNCFRECTSLTSIVLPESIKTVGDHAFDKCSSVREIVIPDSVETLGYGAFGSCTSLRSLTMPIDLEIIKPPSGYDRTVFTGCSGLRELHYTVGKTGCQPDRTGSGDLYYGFGPEQLASGSLKTITYQEGVRRIGNFALNMDNGGSFDRILQLSLPSTLESIGSYAFCGLKSLKKIDLPLSLTKVEACAFKDAAALSDVFYAGAKADWSAVVFGSGNAPLQKADFHEYSTIYAAITEHPVNRELPTDHLARFFVTATGNGVAYCWQHSDDSGETWQDSGSNAASVSCAVSEDTSGRLYRCVVTDQLGRPIVSCTASLTANEDFACMHHETELLDAEPATCTGAGYTGDRICTACGEIIESGEVIPALGHSWDEGIVTREPTETTEGVKTFTCTRCGETRTESIPKLTNPFTDVAKGKFYYDPVLWAISQDPQITTGVTKTTFVPDRICTRAHVVTFLWRANGCPDPQSMTSKFKDVKDTSKYYYKAVLWANEQGITTGYSDGTFRPDDECTRGQVVTFLWRAKGSPAPTGVNNPFSDVPTGKYYTNAVLWALKNNITQGRTATTFGPDDACTRGHVVTFLYRAYAD